MTENGEIPAEALKPDGFQRTLFVVSLVALFGALWLWVIVYSRQYKVVYDQLGMTELPWLTGLLISLSNAAEVVLPLAALSLLIMGVFSLRLATRRTLNRMTAINFIVAALLPGYAYFTMHMPLIELQRKLDGGS